MAPKREKAATNGSTLRPSAARTANVGKQAGLAMSTPTSEPSSRAKTPRKPGTSAKRKWSEEQLLTSDKSALIHMDLVKLLSHPKAWDCLEESEKREILVLLPPDVHPEAQDIPEDLNAKLPPIPDSFIRYSTNWRDGLRQFQLDLENGRYDPEWLRQAQDARQRRTAGEFDDFKEREYEAFWGQKQKVVWNAPAGESARVKLGTLVTQGVVQSGDVWRFHYVFGKGADRIVVEKEARVDAINGAKLTFVVPSGDRVLLRSKFDQERNSSTPKKEEGQEFDLPADSVPALNQNATLDEHTTSQKPPSSPNDGKEHVDSITEAHPVLAAPTHERNLEEEPDFSVVIVSPAKARNAKRTTPLPEPQPPTKRKRGRPRKGAPDSNPEPEHGVPEEPETPIKDQPELAPPITALSILAEEIKKNNQAIDCSYQPEFADLDTLSPLSSPLSSPPASQETVDEHAIAPVDDGTVKIPTDKTEPSVIEGTFMEPTTSDNIEMSPEKVIEADNALYHDTTTVSIIKTEQVASTTPGAPESKTNETPPSSQITTDFVTNDMGELIVPNITTPSSLVLAILQIDGRKPGGRTGNAWKELRCYRDNQDMGSLFDVREAWFMQHGKH
ncbi:hypothetical protein N7452_005522 [Penicillium brevicompactum]|uniref:DEUBAD domain-containing protein n=1 Tax=Penicillium brevicompactum TaxID=5074 RepID=A0A9W9UFS8_PENBR|nr:hypothetical protein N7452_005522 [Penicillium brevicompactum]